MDETGNIDGAWRALGEQLARYRRAAGCRQVQLAERAGYSRSTIANVETGRQHAPVDFWQCVDEILDANGALLAAADEIETATRRQHLDAARETASPLSAHPSSEPPIPASKPDNSASYPAGWIDMVDAAAGQARDHAQKMAVTGIGPGTVEQLQADIMRLSRAYVSSPPGPLFVAMGRSLARVQSALEERAYPAQARELTFMAGAVCGLMANASLDLGREDAADELAMAGWTYGRVIDHGPLMGWARGTQALAAIWDKRHLDAAEHAGKGLTHTPHGVGAARLHAIQARALAAAGDRPQARLALHAAETSHEEARGDDLHHGVGGEFAFSDAKLWYYRALTLADVGDLAQARKAAATAIRLYDQAPDRLRSYGCQALARVELAGAHLKSNKVDEAAQALAGLLTLGPDMRISSLRDHLQEFRTMLRDSASHGSRAARRLEQELATFSAAHAARALPSSG